MTHPPARRLPWLFRVLLRCLPESTRDTIGEPLEATLEEALRADDGTAIGPVRTYAREVASLAALVTRERLRETRGAASEEGWTAMMGQDLRFAFRSLRRNPGTATVSILTLAIGVGAVTAIASVIDGVLVRNLSYAEAGRVLYVGERTPEGGFTSTSWENFRDWESANIFASIGATVGNSVTVVGDGTPERIRGEFVSAGYFDVIGVAPILGRAIAPGEDVPGGPRTAVLSHGWWQTRFAGSPDVIGQTVRLNNEAHTIVGVMTPGFRSPWDDPQAWISLHTAPRNFDRSSRGFQAVIARMHPGQSTQEARSALEASFASLVELYPEANADRGVWVRELSDFLAERNRPFLLGLGVAVLLLLLISCANVTNLQLARAAARQREMAVRTALGGGRRRLVRLVVVENLVVFALGGLAGLVIAWLGVRGLVALQPAYTLYFDVRLNALAAALGLAVAGGTGLLFGLAPAFEVLRSSPSSTLRIGDRGAGAGVGSRRFRAALVVSQLALSASLLVGAGLLARTMSALMGVDTGFDTERLLTLEFRLPQNRYEEVEHRVQFFDQLYDELSSLPGQEGIGFASDLPFSGNGGTVPVIPEGAAVEWEDATPVRVNTVSPGYREAMEIELLAGRDLLPTDDLESPLVLLVSRAAEDLLFGGDAIGRSLQASPDGSTTGLVVGVVDDVQRSLTERPEPYMLVSYRQSPPHFMSVAVRTTGEPMSLASPIREAVWRIDADQPVWEVMPIRERISRRASQTRLNTILVLVFATTALLLASLGLYGVMAYDIRQRERELGVRLALGASPSEVLRSVLIGGLRLVSLGLVFGLVVGRWLASLLESVLFGVEASDPLTFLAALGTLACVGIVSTYLPARRALGLDPVQTLSRG